MDQVLLYSLSDRIKDARPKRILSLDGGGTKGIVTIAMLKKLEDSLKTLLPESERDNFRLNRYFDYIGGTSTGSIIAVLLSLGYSVADVHLLYSNLSKKVFGFSSKKCIAKLSFGTIPGYKAKHIERLLDEKLGDMKLGDSQIKNLLAIFTKNTHTNNIWTFNNNPASKFYNSPDDYQDAYPNKDQYLKDLVRASTAAPYYFSPKELKIRKDTSKKAQTSLFIDGGVSMENNPAFRLFLMATVPYYRLKWNTGENNLLLVSLGTGIFTNNFKSGLLSLISIPDMYIKNSTQTVDAILRGLSTHKNKYIIDKELKDIQPGDFGITPRLTYLRYNYKFRGLPGYKNKWAEMDNPDNLDELYKIVSGSYVFNIDDIPQNFLEHYYTW